MLERAAESYYELLDPIMWTKIMAIQQIDDRDECLSEINNARNDIKNSNDVDEIDDIVINATNIINGIIKTAKDEPVHDDEDDNDPVYIYPDKVIIDELYGNEPKEFFINDKGLEVLDYDQDNDTYMVYARGKLYKFLFNSIKDQLSYHYLAEINKKSFDELMEELPIVVTVSFIDDSMTMVVTDTTNMSIPFVMFGETNKNGECKIYTTREEGLFDLDDARKYFRSDDSDHDTETQQNDIPEDSVNTEIKKEEKIVVNNHGEFDSPLSEEAVMFISETVGYNRDSLKGFTKQLDILMTINPDAGDAIYNAYNDIVMDILTATSIDADAYRGSIKALHNNMKTNYGAEIKAYKHKIKESSRNND